MYINLTILIFLLSACWGHPITYHTCVRPLPLNPCYRGLRICCVSRDDDERINDKSQGRAHRVLGRGSEEGASTGRHRRRDRHKRRARAPQDATPKPSCCDSSRIINSSLQKLLTRGLPALKQIDILTQVPRLYPGRDLLEQHQLQPEVDPVLHGLRRRFSERLH